MFEETILVREVLKKPNIKIENSECDIHCMLEIIESEYNEDNFTHLAYIEDEDMGILLEVWGIEGTAKDSLGEPDFNLEDKAIKLYEMNVKNPVNQGAKK